MPSVEDWIYLAALVDGEGTIGLYCRKDGRFDKLFFVCNTCERLLEWVHDVFGGSRQVRYYSNRKPIHSVWWTSKKDVLEILNGVEPYLKIKCEQAYYMREFLRVVQDYRGRRGYTNDEKDWIHELANGVQQANQVGGG